MFFNWKHCVDASKPPEFAMSGPKRDCRTDIVFPRNIQRWCICLQQTGNALVIVMRLKRSWIARLAIRARNYVIYRLGRGIPVSAATWNSQYANGDWKLLEGESERGHYEAIARLQSKYCGGLSILDVGCGPGITRAFLKVPHQGNYLGIDLSEEAVRQAANRFPDSQFQCMDAEHPEFASRFGLIIFNEVIYYFSRPVETVQRYLSQLEDGGFLIVSMCKYPGHDALWKILAEVLHLVDSNVCRTNDGGEWTVNIYRVRQ